MIWRSSRVAAGRCRNRWTTRSSSEDGSSDVVVSTVFSTRRSRPLSANDRSMALAHSGFPPALGSIAVSSGPGRAASSWAARVVKSAVVNGCSRRVRPPDATRSSISRTSPGGTGPNRAVTTTSSGESDSWRITAEIADRLAWSAQCRSSVTSSTGPWTHAESTRSTMSSMTW